LDARFDVADACFKSKDISDAVHDLDKTPLEGSPDVFTHEDSQSPLSFPCFTYFFITLSFPLSTTLVRLLKILCFFYTDNDLGYEDNMFNMLGRNIDNFMSLGYFSGYNASLDPYFMYLVDAPRKIMWNTFFDFSFDFSMAFGLLKIGLTFVAMFFFIFSYSQAYGAHARVFDKLLQALRASDLMS